MSRRKSTFWDAMFMPLVIVACVVVMGGLGALVMSGTRERDCHEASVFAAICYRSWAQSEMAAADEAGLLPGDLLLRVEHYYLGVMLDDVTSYELVSVLSGSGPASFYDNPPLWFRKLLRDGYVTAGRKGERHYE